MRFFGGAQLPVGVVGAERSIQLSYDRIFSERITYIIIFLPVCKALFLIIPLGQ